MGKTLSFQKNQAIVLGLPEMSDHAAWYFWQKFGIEIKNFFKDEENLREFQEWKNCRNAVLPDKLVCE